MRAGQAEVGAVVASEVLLRDDVFDMVRGLGVLLPVQTGFATVAGALANEFPSGFIPQVAPWDIK